MKSIKNAHRYLILVGIICLFHSCIGEKEKKEHGDKLPNIILMMGDDHGWDEVGYNGHPFVKTPVLDEMASTGLRFDRFYSGHPSCSPTRGSFMTGRHPNRYGTFSPNWSIRPEEITIAHLLKERGYACAHFGKWHLGPVKTTSPTSPGAMGFDEWLSHDNFFELNPVLSENGKDPKEYSGESSQVIVDAAKDFIGRKHKNGQPVFVVIWFGSPHEPYSGLEKDLNLYNDLPDSLSAVQVSLTSNETGKKTKRTLKGVLRERYAEITAMDRSIGNLRTYLKDSQQKENTILFYCGDNGTPPSAGRTGMTIRSQKGNIYEGGILVPGVVEWPAKIKTAEATGLVSVTSDILPTVAALAGVKVPKRPLDGLDLGPLLENGEEKRPEPVCFWKFATKNAFPDPQNYIDPELQEGTTPLAKMMNGKYTRTFRNYVFPQIQPEHFSGGRAVIGNRYKLVLEGENPNTNGVELYDLRNDRAETTNIADKHPEVVSEMQSQLSDWQKSVLNSLTGADYVK